MTEREQDLLRELTNLRVENKFLRERVGYLRGDIEITWMQSIAERERLSAVLRERIKELVDARAEIELLDKRLGDKSAAKMAEINAAFTEGTLVAGDVMRPQVAAAYQRGAEAMREAAADLFQGNKPGLAAIPTWSAFIRALPIPEDKP